MLTIEMLLAGGLVLVALGASPAARPSEGFRKHHADILVHLGHLDQKAGELERGNPAEQKKAMDFIVTFLNEHIRKHAAEEERVLYPAVDKHAETGANRFTATMRHEHVIIGRWIDELADMAKKPSPDAKAFARRAHNVLGLIRAHFEEEEEVLLPVLDKKLTPAQFEQEVGSKMKGE